ncbi:sigma-w pathway protein ysdB [Lederbergia sp. NSJ-179]|uniref:sigma-w pathway protein ysdB n=1 Tax=Lederbergia sp. NSJ-179 TaxID=2931402 RepID=UPI001FD3C274|nr:sigma-w pathway protein ysdB [Lederbergia sp. NSJ-179]MCJ7839802.1 sigma-w pathway protein ysdB [Lederbergia sp. NSJ-179]
MLILLRVAIFAFIIYLIYKIIKFILDPKRKLETAHEQKKYFFYDVPDNIRKNFLITFNGVMFEGEKYLGTTDRSFEVVSIFVWPHNPNLLKGLSYEDFKFIENEIQLRYPDSTIDWKSPIKELMARNKK